MDPLQQSKQGSLNIQRGINKEITQPDFFWRHEISMTTAVMNLIVFLGEHEKEMNRH